MLPKWGKVLMPLGALALVTALLAGCTSLPGKTGLHCSAGKSAAAPNATLSVPAASSVPAGLAGLNEEKSILEKYTTQKIRYFGKFSFGNNQNAAFAIAGNEVWFVTAAGAQKLKSGIYFPPDAPPVAPALWAIEGATIFKFEETSGGSSTKSDAWYVKNGKPVELSCTGMYLSYQNNGQFTTIGEDFDHIFENGKEAGGHTYKTYYLYWDWAGSGLKEYGGIKITQQQTLKVKGAEAIIHTLTESGHVIDEIYYRGNNVININYHAGDKSDGMFDNVTLLYRNNMVTPVLANSNSAGAKAEEFDKRNLPDFSYGGIYRAALFPQIATYPGKFPLK